MIIIDIWFHIPHGELGIMSSHPLDFYPFPFSQSHFISLTFIAITPTVIICQCNVTLHEPTGFYGLLNYWFVSVTLASLYLLDQSVLIGHSFIQLLYFFLKASDGFPFVVYIFIFTFNLQTYFSCGAGLNHMVIVISIIIMLIRLNFFIV